MNDKLPSLLIWPWKSKVKVMTKVKTNDYIWGPYINSSFCGNQIILQWDIKFHIWPWIFKVKVMAMVKPVGHIWGLEFNWYVWFSFHGNWTIFGWDIANSIFELSWKFKVKVMAIQTHWSHLRPTVWLICLLFVSWQSDHFGWDLANSIFDLENSRSRSQWKHTKI